MVAVARISGRLGSYMIAQGSFVGLNRCFSRVGEVAGCLGLTPTPYASGNSEVEQGISKCGNKRVRWLMVELAWSWLRFQPAARQTR